MNFYRKLSYNFVEWLLCKYSGRKNKSVPKVKTAGFPTVKMVFNVLVQRFKNTYPAYKDKMLLNEKKE